MKNSNMVFRLDIQDYKSKRDVLETIKKILDIIDNEGFVENFQTIEKSERGFKVDIKTGISFVLTDCNCD
jgi:ribosomal protein S8